MKKTKRLGIILSIIISTFFIILYTITIGIDHFSKNHYDIKDGILDLNGKDISQDSTKLLGEWKFYDKQWIVTDNIDSDNFMMAKIPEKWTTYNSDFSVSGYGSYQLLIRNYRCNNDITFVIPMIRCAYRVFINNELVIEVEKLDKDTTKINSNALVKIDNFPKLIYNGEDLNIVIELSTTMIGGLDYIPEIGNYTKIIADRAFSYAYYFIFLGLVFCSAFTLFIIRLIEGEKQATSLSTIFFIVIFFRALFSAPIVNILQKGIPSINYENIFIYSFILYLIAMIMVLTLVYKSFTIRNVISCKRFFIRANFVYAFLIIVSIILYLFNVFTQLSIFVWLISQIPLIFITYYFGADIKLNTRRDIYLGTYIVVIYFAIFGLSINILNINGFINTNYNLIYYISILLCYLAMIVIHSFRTNDLYQESLNSSKLKEELTQSKVSLLLSQIRPHFLYNTLNAIRYLCHTNPEKAEEAIIVFSNYLRGNMKSIEQKECIFFDSELDHIKNYLIIEKIRFGDKLNIVYEINTSDFLVPPLSIQPIVENAIKHGISKKIDGGTIIIKTYEDDDYTYIEIIDDGCGFDCSNIYQDNSQSLGIINVTKRLKMITNATISFNSVINIGTTVTIKIPKN